MARLTLLSIGYLVGTCALWSQGISAFDVASVKPSQPGKQFSCNTLPSGRFVCHNMPLLNLIALAFRDQPMLPEGHFPRFKGAPAWASDQFDIDAVTEGGGEMTDAQLARPLRALLEERFGLVARLETVQEAGYNLQLQRSGAKLKRSPPDATYTTRRTPEGVVFNATTMQQLGAMMENRRDIHAAVIDNTGLEGRYDFSYKFKRAPDETPLTVQTQPEDEYSTRESLAELGLELIPAKVTVSVIVIDQIHRPSAN